MPIMNNGLAYKQPIQLGQASIQMLFERAAAPNSDSEDAMFESPWRPYASDAV